MKLQGIGHGAVFVWVRIGLFSNESFDHINVAEIIFAHDLHLLHTYYIIYRYTR